MWLLFFFPLRCCLLEGLKILPNGFQNQTKFNLINPVGHLDTTIFKLIFRAVTETPTSSFVFANQFRKIWLALVVCLFLFMLPESRSSSGIPRPCELLISFPWTNFHLGNWIIISPDSFLLWKCGIHCELLLGFVMTFILSIRKIVVLGKYFDSLTIPGMLLELSSHHAQYKSNRYN